MTQQERIDWILDYAMAAPGRGVDILNSDFVDAYAAATGARVQIKMFGANYCPQLGRDLKAALDAGDFRRQRVGMAGLPAGFPSWVWHYSL